MKVLVVGGGGREHAIVWKLSQDSRVTEIYCAPGNGGIASIAKCVPIKSVDIEEMAIFAHDSGIDLTIVGNDDPLAAGIVDRFEELNLRVFGPRKNAAIIEYSKAFSKEFMKRHSIPTAEYAVFSDYEAAVEYCRVCKYPMVVKADGLALGKGVIICNDNDEAVAALRQIMIDQKFGQSGNSVVIEEFLVGHEVTVLAFCDGKTFSPMASSQDHKRQFDNDRGLNTGGMGAFSPSFRYTAEIHEECMKIYQATVDGLRGEGREFKGILYFGLMLTDSGVKVIEYNARFGDPEAQVVLPRMQTDLLDVVEACIDGRLAEIDIKWDDNACCCVILASGGYPEKYRTGIEIHGLNQVECMVFHSGTVLTDGRVMTAGGRVLGVTAVGRDLDAAIDSAYSAVDKISFENMFYRRDIGAVRK